MLTIVAVISNNCTPEEPRTRHGTATSQLDRISAAIERWWLNSAAGVGDGQLAGLVQGSQIIEQRAIPHRKNKSMPDIIMMALSWHQTLEGKKSRLE
jgi:hypothetical protein